MNDIEKVGHQVFLKLVNNHYIPKEIANIIVFQLSIGECKSRMCSYKTYNDYCRLHECFIKECKNEISSKFLCEKCCIKYMCPDCPNLKLPGYEHCEHHMCGIKNCLKSRHECNEHECYNCEYINYSIGPNCKKCKCKYFLCKELRLQKNYCYEHNCRFNPCNNAKLKGYLYCENHKCLWEGCSNSSYFYNSSRYCMAHVCAECKDEPRIEDSLYCEKHTCGEKGCTKCVELFFKTSYCIEHRCFYCPKKKIVGSVTCGGHKCKICGKREYLKSSLCIRHKCTTSNCFDQALYNHRFCDKHLCNFQIHKRRCPNEKISGLSDYCVLHTCYALGCTKNVIEDGKDGCETHFE